MFYKINKIYFIEIVWVLLLPILACLVYLNQDFIGLFFNSDHLLLPSLFKDIFLNHGHYKDWSLSPAPHFFPDMLIFSAAFILTKNVYFQFLITLCLQQILIYISVRFIYIQFFKKEIAILFSLVSVSIFYLMIFTNYAPYANLALAPTLHVGEFIIGIFFVGIQLKIINCLEKENFKYNTLFLIGILLSFFSSLSDILFLIQFSLAIFFSYFIFYITKYIKLKSAIYYSFFPVFASVAGAALMKHVVPVNMLFNYLGYPSLKNLSWNIINSEFSAFLSIFKNEVNWFSSVLFVLFYSGVIFFLSFFIFKSNINQRNSLNRKTFFLSIFIFISVGLSIISVFLLAQENHMLSRYMFPLFFFPILLFFYLSVPWLKYRSIYNGLICLVIFSFLGVILNIFLLFNKPGFKVKLDYYPDYISCIDLALQGHDSRGIAQYWDANLISMLSKKNLEIVPLSSNLAIFPWAINLKKFNNPYSFSIVDSPSDPVWNIDQKLVEAHNGKPQKTITCGDKKLFIYPDRKLIIPLFKNPGDRFTWPAATLPSEFPNSKLINTRSVKQTDGPGYVTFGPYVPLSQGRYQIYITYWNDSKSNKQIGHWDIVTGKKGLLSVVSLFGTNRKHKQITGTLIVTPDLAEDIFQIRTFFAGHSQLVVERLTILKKE